MSTLNINQPNNYKIKVICNFLQNLNFYLNLSSYKMYSDRYEMVYKFSKELGITLDSLENLSEESFNKDKLKDDLHKLLSNSLIKKEFLYYQVKTDIFNLIYEIRKNLTKDFIAKIKHDFKLAKLNYNLVGLDNCSEKTLTNLVQFADNNKNIADWRQL